VYVYGYDPVGRLRTVTRDGILVEEYTYAQDLNGKLYTDTNTLRGVSRTYSYSDEEHLFTVTGSNPATYQHTLDGFLERKTEGSNITQYVYSSRGELLSVSLPDEREIEYLYDPLGRRTAKKIDDVITEKYLWQDMTRLLAVFDASETSSMRFEYADGRMPVAMTSGGVRYCLSFDQVGTLRAVVDGSGAVVRSVDYDSFGNVITDTNPGLVVPFGFAGGLYDRDTGLVRFGFRDYKPATGRRTAKDPVGFNGGDYDLYGYVVNDPVNWIDPEGLRGVPSPPPNIMPRPNPANPDGMAPRLPYPVAPGCRDVQVPVCVDPPGPCDGNPRCVLPSEPSCKKWGWRPGVNCNGNTHVY
jgi:RHS repeat-associated protein